MMFRRTDSLLTVLVVAGLAGAAQAQTTLYALDASGNLITLDKTTGAGTLVGPTGFPGLNAAASDSQGRIFTISSGSSQLVLVDPVTGVGSVFLNLSGRPSGYGVRGMAFDPSDHLYVALSQAETTAIDILATIDMTTGAYTTVGSTGRTDIQALDISPAGAMYAIGVFGGLYQLNPATGAATVIGGSFGGDDQALQFDRDGTLYACRGGLRLVDPVTGATTLIGPTGFTDIRGMAVSAALTPPSCYANCDGSTIVPVLNVQDFSCFLNRFASGDSYANCDLSTTPPVLNVQDFSCFLNQFAAGCS